MYATTVPSSQIDNEVKLLSHHHHGRREGKKKYLQEFLANQKVDHRGSYTNVVLNRACSWDIALLTILGYPHVMNG